MNLRPWRVLVADDDPEICTLITTILRNGPYAVTTVNDAETALLRVRTDEPYDLMICDFMLPGISGIDLISQVRANARSAGVPIVMISGHNNYAMDNRARAAGANAFLNKPFTLSQLRTTMASLLDTPPPVSAAAR